MKLCLLLLVWALLPTASFSQEKPEWILGATTDRAQSGERFEVMIAHRDGAALPEELRLRVRAGQVDHLVVLKHEGGGAYAGTMPQGLAGTFTLQLADHRSTVLSLVVTPRSDVVQALAGGRTPDYEPPLSENDPMYFIAGGRGGYSARFQLSFKYRLFDLGTGFGVERPWLSGLYFGYTQNSLWDLSSESKAFRDTSYRPSLFWRWERADEKTFIDALRAGIEHESNGRDGPRSRSLNTAFIRPEWHWRKDGRHLEFTPKFYGTFDNEENPDIHRYRGYADWRLRYDHEGEWITTAVARVGTSGKGSVLLDVSKRARDLKFGPVGGYWHVQYFTGYGEDILDYNVRRKSQIRIGFAIVP